MGKVKNETNQRSYMHTRVPVHGFVHQWGPLTWPVGIGLKPGLQYPPRGLRLQEGTDQAKGLHQYTNPCTGPLVIYNYFFKILGKPQ